MDSPTSALAAKCMMASGRAACTARKRSPSVSGWPKTNLARASTAESTVAGFSGQVFKNAAVVRFERVEIDARDRRANHPREIVPTPKPECRSRGNAAESRTPPGPNINGRIADVVCEESGVERALLGDERVAGCARDGQKIGIDPPVQRSGG